MTRHAKDADLMGGVVYFLSCAFNSAAIFLSQMPYFALGLPLFINILMIIIRLIVNFDEHGDMPPSDSTVIVFMVLVVVIVPLKLIPIKFAKTLNRITNDWILNVPKHLHEKNRSGYDVPGMKKALFMFLPSASNNHDHINKKNSSGAGFFYFSKDPLSRRLYRLRFECHLFCKVAMHTLYLALVVLMVNTIHITMEYSTLVASCYWLQILTSSSINALGKPIFLPTLLLFSNKHEPCPSSLPSYVLWTL